MPYPPKNIMMVCYPSYGGSGVVATELGKALAMNNHRVHFVSYDIPVRLLDFHPNIFFHEVKPLEYDLFKFPMYEGALVSQIIDIAIHQKIDVIHTHYAIPHAYSALLAKQAILMQKKDLPIKIMTTLHGTDITLVGKEESYKSLVEYSINACDAVTCVSDFLRKETFRLFNINRDISVIYNFVEKRENIAEEKTNSEIYRRMVSKEGNKIICHISNFRKVKRTTDVIKIFHKTLQLFSDITLIMVGDGPDRYDAESLSRELGICDKVKFLGKVDQVGAILKISDIFILPSENESFGLAALEAMSFGVPVIATDIGGIPEVIIDNESGFLHPLGDIDGMSVSTLKLLQDESLWNRISVGAYKRSLLFSQDKIVAEYEKIYNEI